MARRLAPPRPVSSVRKYQVKKSITDDARAGCSSACYYSYVLLTASNWDQKSTRGRKFVESILTLSQQNVTIVCTILPTLLLHYFSSKWKSTFKKSKIICTDILRKQLFFMHGIKISHYWEHMYCKIGQLFRFKDEKDVKTLSYVF